MAGERLDDEHCALLEQALANIENGYSPTCRTASYGNGCPGATDESLDFWRRAVDCLPSMLAELRERRAADLTADDLEALRNLQIHVTPHYAPCHAKGGILAVLDKLLSSGGAK